MLQCLGDQPTHFILIFDNGYFSEFGTFSMTDWLGHTRGLLAKNSACPPTSLPAGRGKRFISPAGRSRPAHRPRRSGWKLPPHSHKYEMLKQAPHAEFAGGREWRVDSSTFPISTTMTGIVLDLEPGGLRELHWHPTADEWNYVVSGQISVTLFGSHGRFRSERLDAGDVGYIPQGYGHSIENVGSQACRVLIAFNTGNYAAIDLSQWIAGNPADVLAANFGLPAALFEQFPKSDVFIADRGGRWRTTALAVRRAGRIRTSRTVFAPIRNCCSAPTSKPCCWPRWSWSAWRCRPWYSGCTFRRRFRFRCPRRRSRRWRSCR